MTEAVTMVVTWAFAHLERLMVVRSGCLTRNVGSRRVLEKAGFRLSGFEKIRFGAKFNHQILGVSNFERRRPDRGQTY